jgi:hypothetical protein
LRDTQYLKKRKVHQMNTYTELELEVAVKFGSDFISNDTESVVNAYKVFSTLSNKEKNKIVSRRIGFDVF